MEKSCRRAGAAPVRPMSFVSAVGRRIILPDGSDKNQCRSDLLPCWRLSRHSALSSDRKAAQPSWWQASSSPLGLWDALYKDETASIPTTCGRCSNPPLRRQLISPLAGSACPISRPSKNVSALPLPSKASRTLPAAPSNNVCRTLAEVFSAPDGSGIFASAPSAGVLS